MENSTANNPLAKHFRQPAIYITLPSGGKFWPEGSIDIPLTGEIPVYPMTVKDEMLLKTPDALMNGASIVNMIHSCCPNITNAWLCPVVDLDAILIAIRLASYGNSMEFTSICPHCQTVNDNAIDLRVLLDSIKPITYNSTATIQNLVFHFKPQSFENLNQVSQVTFEQQKLVSSIIDSELPEDQKAELFREGFAKLTNLNLSMLASCIDSIEADGQQVADVDQIKEFLDNVDLKSYEEIKDKVQVLVDQNKIEPLGLTCSNCDSTYQTNLEFNQSNFFV